MSLVASSSGIVPLNLAPLSESSQARRRVAAIPQQMTYWCWAACVEMIVANDGGSVTQEAVVNWALRRDDCRGRNGPEACNKPLAGPAQGELPGIVDVLAHFGVDAKYDQSITHPAKLMTKLDAGPVILIVRGDTTGHVALAVGYQKTANPDEPSILINDPRPAGGRELALGYTLLRAGGATLGPWSESIYIRQKP
jgi:hypothetical protein